MAVTDGDVAPHAVCPRCGKPLTEDRPVDAQGYYYWHITEDDAVACSRDRRCTCDGCSACSGHEPGCTCDVDWDRIYEKGTG